MKKILFLFFMFIMENVYSVEVCVPDFPPEQSCIAQGYTLNSFRFINVLATSGYDRLVPHVICRKPNGTLAGERSINCTVQYSCAEGADELTGQCTCNDGQPPNLDGTCPSCPGTLVNDICVICSDGQTVDPVSGECGCSAGDVLIGGECGQCPSGTYYDPLLQICVSDFLCPPGQSKNERGECVWDDCNSEGPGYSSSIDGPQCTQGCGFSCSGGWCSRTGQQCDDLCDVDPTLHFCDPQFCNNNPDDPNCQPDPCEENPLLPECDPNSCGSNPWLPHCDECVINPAAPGCEDDPCKNSPWLPQCSDDPCIKFPELCEKEGDLCKRFPRLCEEKNPCQIYPELCGDGDGDNQPDDPCVINPALCDANSDPCEIYPQLCERRDICEKYPELCKEVDPCDKYPHLCEEKDPCIINPELCKPDKDPCEIYPELCKEDPCKKNPHLPQCQSDPCEKYPLSPECGGDPCIVYPTLPQCQQPNPCDLDPTLPGCENGGGGPREASGGNDCSAAPACSGDQIDCMVVQQIWLSRCDKGEIPEDDGEINLPTAKADVGTINPERYISGSCPADLQFSVFSVNYSIDLGPLCDLAEIISWIIMIGAAFVSLRILGSVGGF